MNWVGSAAQVAACPDKVVTAFPQLPTVGLTGSKCKPWRRTSEKELTRMSINHGAIADSPARENLPEVADFREV